MADKLSRLVSRRGPAVVVMVALLTLASACGKKSGSNSSTSGGNAFGAKESSTIAAEVPSSVKSKGSVTVAVDASYAPNEFFAADNKEREQTVDMVTYFSAGTSFYVNTNGGPDIGSLDDLCGHSVAVEKGTTQLDDATAQSKTCTDAGKPAVSVSAFPDQNGANLALSSGRAEVGMADSPVAAYQVKLSNGKFKLSGQPYGVAPYGIAVPRPSGSAPGTGPMSKPILDALKELISDGVYVKILTKWGVQAGAITSPAINGAVS